MDLLCSNSPRQLPQPLPPDPCRLLQPGQHRARPRQGHRQRQPGPHRPRVEVPGAHSSVGLRRMRRSGGEKAEELEVCVEQIGDSVEELRKTLKELKHLRGETCRWLMSNAETWVSAALTNEDTCLDGFHGVSSKLKSDGRQKITNVARVTNNALYMINRLDQARRRTP